MKTCPRCGKRKKLEHFSFTTTTQKHSSWCKVCNAEAAKKYRDPEKKRQSHFRVKYGIEYDDYLRMLAVQGGLCAICGREETRRSTIGDLRPLCLDHDHVTGAIRGLLCSSCNQALGFMQDDPIRLRAAAKYLEDLRG